MTRVNHGTFSKRSRYWPSPSGSIIRTALQIVVNIIKKKFVRSDDSSNNFHLPRRV